MLILLMAALQTQQPPPVRQINAITAVSRDTLSAVTTAVEVGGGRVFVNDILGRRVLLYDSTLSTAVVVADSDASALNAYGTRPATLMHFRGDSALFITPSSMSMQVVGPSGQISRVMAMPSFGGGPGAALLGSIFGTPGFDAHGRLVFFSPIRLNIQMRGPPGDAPMRMEPPDSAYVVRYDLATRTMDTAAVIRIPRTRTTMTRDDRGAFRTTMVAFPPMTVDDWAVASDGRLAVVRGRDYHVDWLNAEGIWSSTPRMPYTWQQLTDEAKTALVDSVQAAMQAQMDSMSARMARGEGPAGAPPRGGAPATGGGGGGGMVMIMTGPGPAADGGGGGGGGGPPRTMTMGAPTVVKAEPGDVPDYRPAFGQGAVRADRDGNVWIRTTTMLDGRPVYDVVNSRGELIDRVQFPANRTLAGFGNGVVFLGVRDENGIVHLERARIR